MDINPDYVAAITAQALTFNGQTGVVVNLIGGGSLTGTVACATVASWPGNRYPLTLTLTDSGSKAHMVRIDHVSSIGK